MMGGKDCKAITSHFGTDSVPGILPMALAREGMTGPYANTATELLQPSAHPGKHNCSSGEVHGEIWPEEAGLPESISSSQGHYGSKPTLDECTMAVMMLLEEVVFLLQELTGIYGLEFLECSQPIDVKPFFMSGWHSEDTFKFRYNLPDFFVDHWDSWCQAKDMLENLTKEEFLSLLDS